MTRHEVAVAFGLTLALTGPALAQRVDVAVDGLKVAPSQPQPDKPVTIQATVRRLVPAPPVLKDPIQVQVEFLVDQESSPFASRQVVLGLGQATTVQASWPARPGQHAFRVRATRLLLKGQPLQDVSLANNQVAGGPVLVRAPAPEVVARPSGAGPAPPSAPGASALPAPAASLLPGAVEGFLTVPADLPARYRVTLEGRAGFRRVDDITEAGERRPYRFDAVPPGEYRLTPEVLPVNPGDPRPAGRWAPGREIIDLRPGERLAGVRAPGFEFQAAATEPDAGAGEGQAAASPPTRSVPLAIRFTPLTINGDGIGPVVVRNERRDSAVVRWNLPAERANAIQLRFGRTPFPDPPDCRAGAAADRMPAADYPAPDGGLHRDAMGSVELDLDHPAYMPGLTYHVVGCLARDDRAAFVLTGEHTNAVAFAYQPVIGVLPSALPDLAITGVTIGGDGRVGVTVRAHTPATDGPPPGPVGYRVDLHDGRAVDYFGRFGSPFWTERGTFSLDPRLGVGVFTTRAALPPGDGVFAAVVHINTDETVASPYRPDGTLAPGGYAETSFENNRWVEHARRGSSTSVVTGVDVRPLQQGLNWALLAVRYTFLPDNVGDRGAVFLDLPPAPGASAGVSVRCAGPTGPALAAITGTDQGHAFLCRAEGSGGEFWTRTAEIRIEFGPEGHGRSSQRSFPLPLPWYTPETPPARPVPLIPPAPLPDLVPVITRLDVTRSGVSVSFRLWNAGRAPAAHVDVTVFVDDRDGRRTLVREEGAFRIQPGAFQEYQVPIPRSLHREGSRVVVQADSRLRLLESGRGNNTVTRAFLFSRGGLEGGSSIDLIPDGRGGPGSR
jgi:hypothetical protein